MTDDQNDTLNDTNNDIIILLEKVAYSEGIRDFQIQIGVGAVKGDGYVGLINSAEITGRDNENKQKVLKVVVKSAKKSQALRELMPMSEIFDREIYVYEKIFPIYRNFEIEKGLTPTRFAPKFYKASTSNMSEAIVMENLKELNYRLYERRMPMDDIHVRLVLEQYGRLHAISFALKDQNPEQFVKLTSTLDDNFGKILKEIKFLDNILYKYKSSLNNLDPVNDKKAYIICEKFYDKIVEFFDTLIDLVDDYSVILHGDCWTNNMMFKYDDKCNPTKPTRVDLLDFQVTRLGPPVLDLSYFFYACSSKDIIDNYENYLRVYYGSLSSHLRKLGSNPEVLFPYEVLKKQWKENAKFGLILSVLVIHVMLSEQEETIDFAEVADSGENVVDALKYEIANIDEYNDRVRHNLIHFVENDLI